MGKRLPVTTLDSLAPSHTFGRYIYWGSIAVYLLLAYGSYAYFRYPGPPGGDIYNHYLWVEYVRDHGLSALVGGYPKLFHLFVLLGTNFTGSSYLTFLLLITPLLVVGAALSWGKLARLIAGPSAEVLTVIGLLFVSNQPHQTLSDGGFPNFIAAGILLPFAVYAMSRLDDGVQRSRYVLLLVVMGISVILTHHITTFYMLALLAFFGLAKFWKRPKYIVGMLALLVVLIISPLGDGARVLLADVIRFGGGFPWVHVTHGLDNPNAIWGLADYPVGISYAVVYLGLPGLFYLLYLARTSDPGSKRTAAWLVGLFGLLLLILSRLELFGFPVRLARDSALALTVAASVFLVAIWQFLPRTIVPRLLVVLVTAYLALPHVQVTLSHFFKYDERLEYSAATAQVVEVVGSTPAVSINLLMPLMTSPSSRFLAIPQNMSEEEVRIQLSQAPLAYFEVVGSEEPWLRDLLEKVGYKERAVFEDPIRTIFLYEKKDVLE